MTTVQTLAELYQILGNVYLHLSNYRSGMRTLIDKDTSCRLGTYNNMIKHCVQTEELVHQSSRPTVVRSNPRYFV